MDNITAACAALAELQVKRKYCIKLANKQINSARALARRYCGFKWDAPESDRTKINKRAAGIVEHALDGKSQKPEDSDIAAIMGPELEILAYCLAPLTKRRNDVERDMKRLARSLPVWAWAKNVKGLGELGLAVIVAEANDLSAYPNVRHLWKRLGLAPYEGRAMSRWHGNELSADEWTEAGYSGKRRAEIFACVGEPLFRAQTVAAGPYRLAYDTRRAHCEAVHADWPKCHFHADASRIMTKALIKDLWQQWHHVADIALPPDKWLLAAE